MGSVIETWLERFRARAWPLGMSARSPFRYFKTSPAIIRLAVMIWIRFPLSKRNFESLLDERGIDVGHEMPRFCESHEVSQFCPTK